MGQRTAQDIGLRPVAGVRVDDELRVRQILLQRETVDRGNDQVIAAINHERRLMDWREIVPDAVGLLVRADNCRVLRCRCGLADFRGCDPDGEACA